MRDAFVNNSKYEKKEDIERQRVLRRTKDTEKQKAYEKLQSLKVSSFS